MFPHQVIYQAGLSEINGQVSLKAPFKVRFLFAFMQSTGVFIIGLVIYGVIYSMVPVAQAEIDYATNQIIPSEESKKIQEVVNKLVEPKYDYSDADETVRVQSAAAALGVDSHFSVVVPKIDAKSNITVNVDPSNEKIYSAALKNGVAHASGTYFPGQGKLVYLFSHSTNAPWNVTRYSAIFYLLNKLEAGDTIIVFFADRQYEYKVEEIVVTGPNDTSWLDPNNKNIEGETLVLQTCTPAGTSLRRLLVIAKPVDNGASAN